MKIWGFWHRETGQFANVRFTTDVADSGQHEAHVAANTPADHVAIEGLYDPLSQRVDPATSAVIDFQPARPSPDYVWEETTKRWTLTAAVVDRNAKRAAALVRISQLEASQHRPLREISMDPQNVQARDRLLAIDTEIASLRADLARG